MKLTCLQENLNQILSVVAKIASFNKSGLPILNNILLNTENSHLKLTATNLEIAIEAKVRVKIEKEGKIAIPAGIFSNYINSLSKENCLPEYYFCYSWLAWCVSAFSCSLTHISLTA